MRAWQEKGERGAIERLLAIEIGAVKRSLRRGTDRQSVARAAGDASDFAHSALRRFLEQEGLPRFESPDRLRAYLTKTARNRRLECRMRDRHQPAQADAFPAHSGGIGALERRDQIREVLPHLEPALREIVELQFFHGLSRGEVCERLGISKQTASDRTLRALSFLKRLLAR